MSEDGVIYSNRTTETIDMVSIYLCLIEGTLIFVSNTSLALLILKVRSLSRQKEFVLFAVNMFFDAIFGIAYMLAGLYSIYLYTNLHWIPMYTRWQCFWRIHSQFFVVITPVMGLISLVNAIDRLLSVTFPGWYFKLQWHYALILSSFVVASIIPCYTASLFTSLQATDLVIGLCNLQHSVTIDMYVTLRLIRISSSIIAALLYIPIIICLRRIMHNSALYSAKQKTKLYHMTITIILITVNELVLFTAPDIYVIINPDTNSLIFFVMNMNKGIISTIIFVATQKELKKYVINLGQSKVAHMSRSPVNIQNRRNTNTVAALT